MAEPNQKDHAFRRVKQLYTRTKLTPQEVATHARMSVNTAKKVLFGAKAGEKEAHVNSVLRVERALEQYLKELQSGDHDKEQLVLSGETSTDVLTLAKKLATMMQEMVLEPEKAKSMDREALARLLQSCSGNLAALSVAPLNP